MKRIISVLAAFSICFSLSSCGKKEEVYQTKTVDETPVIIETEDHEKHVVSELSVSAILEPASELVTQKYHYRSADIYEDSKMFKDFKLPFTTNMFVFSYEGEINAGFEFSDIKFEINNDKELITISLPKAKILSHTIDESSLEFKDAKNSIFNATEFGDYAELMIEQKKKEEIRLEENEVFWDAVNDNAKTTFENLLKLSGDTSEYTIVFSTK